MNLLGDRVRNLSALASAAALVAVSFGAGRVLTAQNTAATMTFEENPVAGVTIPTLLEDVPEPTTSTTAVPVVTTAPVVAAPVATTPTTAANVCRWAAKILRGGFEDARHGPADQLVVTLTKPSWAGRHIAYRPNYSPPAVTRTVDNYAPRSALADAAGTVQFLIPIGPESQGGSISLLARPKSLDDGNDMVTPSADICDWHEFRIDYNGPQGLVGGIVNSAVRDLDALLAELNVLP